LVNQALWGVFLATCCKKLKLQVFIPAATKKMAAKIEKVSSETNSALLIVGAVFNRDIIGLAPGSFIPSIVLCSKPHWVFETK